MRKVAALREIQPHKRVARIQTSHNCSHIGLSAGMGLNICPLRAKEFLEAVNSQLFRLVHHLITAIITLSGLARGIFIGKARPHGSKYLRAYKILGSYKLHTHVLTCVFARDNVENLLVLIHNLLLFLFVFSY